MIAGPRLRRWFGLPLLLGMFFLQTGHALTIDLGGAGVDYITPGLEWGFLRGWEAAPADWINVDFNDALWEQGPAGFGYGDGDDATQLDDMRRNYLTVYVRKTFIVNKIVPDAPLELLINYDDGFVAYLNGHEVARESMPSGVVGVNTSAKSHEAGEFERIVLGKAGELLNPGRNILAIEGHNISLSSSDFSLHPTLRTASDTLRSDDTWIVGTNTVALSGQTEVAKTVAVWIGATPANFDATDGSWSAVVPLEPGINTLTASALDSEDQEVDSGTIEVIYVPTGSEVSGPVVEDTTWRGAVVLEEPIVVDVNTTLTIAPDTVVLMQDEVTIDVRGQLIADGNESNPILFSHYGDGTAWQQILFTGNQDSRLSYCTFEHADSDGAHQDYYEPGPRDYHEAIVVLTGHVDFDHCTFQKLPVEGRQSDGDAIAVISDDRDTPGPASAAVRGCQFLGIGQGVHTRYAYVLVEDCFFTGKHGDNDDVDLYGESDPPPLIRNNLFLDPDHDDMINPTKCSAIIEGNIISGSDDHGIVLRDICYPILRNNLIMDCSSAGIAVENSCEALLVNNTIVDCGRGIRLLDLGRWGPPYRLNPGGGFATVINCIIWDCSTPITLADSSNQEIRDRGSHITVLFSDIEGGQDGVSVGGSQSTLTWGEGNLNADPLFVDPDNGDYRLQSESPVIDVGHAGDAPSIDMDGLLRPCGDGVDMGASEFGDCAAAE